MWHGCMLALPEVEDLCICVCHGETAIHPPRCKAAPTPSSFKSLGAFCSPQNKLQRAGCTGRPCDVGSNQNFRKAEPATPDVPLLTQTETSCTTNKVHAFTHSIGGTLSEDIICQKQLSIFVIAFQRSQEMKGSFIYKDPTQK